MMAQDQDLDVFGPIVAASRASQPNTRSAARGQSRGGRAAGGSQRSGTVTCARRLSRRRQPIIMAVALVLAETIDGMTEASATDRPSTARQASRGSITAIALVPRAQLPTRVVAGSCDGSDVVLDLLEGTGPWPRQDLVDLQARPVHGLRHGTGKSQSFGQ
jgi:hypothetical protein